MKFPDLPEKIKVKVKKCSHGKYLAELPEYDLHTQINNKDELLEMVNDLIYCFFDIPSGLQKFISYKPVDENRDFEKIKPFLMFSTPNLYKKYFKNV